MTSAQYCKLASSFKTAAKPGILRGIGSGIKNTVGGAWSTSRAAAEAAGKHLEGLGAPKLVAGAARIAPFAALAYGGQKAWQSDPVQRLRYRIAMHRANQGMGQ